jgi:3-hydroxyisobutyrate dehydrogenase-like beta-hydroxyacid dehydrogenase
MGAEAAALYGMFQASGKGERDYSAIISMLRGGTDQA